MNGCSVCGRPVNQCECQAFSESPLPDQNQQVDTAIREGEPPTPNKPDASPANKPDTSYYSCLMVWFGGLCGALIGAVVVGILVFNLWSRSDTPIGSALIAFLAGGLCYGAPPGFILGMFVCTLLVIFGVIRPKK